MEGLFCGPFVLQTFAAHLSAIDRSVQVPDLLDISFANANGVGALGLAAASVCPFTMRTGFF